MPVLPTLDMLNTRPARGQPSYRASPVGGALQGLGQEIGQLGTTLMQQQERDKAVLDKQEAFGVQSRFLQFDDQWSKSFVDRARNAPAGAANFNDTLQKDYMTSAKEFMGTVPTQLRQEYDQKLFGLESRLTDAGQKFQTQEGDRYQTEQIDLGQNVPLDRVRKNPAEWKGAAAEGEQHILNSSLPQNVKDAKILEWRQRLAKGLVETQAETNPDAARGVLGVDTAPVSANISGVYQGLQQRGLSPMHAAVIAGNVKQESGGNPNSLNAKEGAHGIIQWRAERWTALKNFAAASGRDPNDINAQLDFILFEGTGAEKAAFDRFLAAGTPQEANRALKGYIRYGDSSEGTRLQNAIAISGGKDMNQGQGPTVATAAQLSAAVPTAPSVDPELAKFIQTNIPYEDRVKTYNQITVADQKQFAQQATDYSEFLRSGETPTPQQQEQFSQPVLQQRLGMDAGQKVYDQLQQDAAYGSDVASLKFASPQETQQIISDRQAALSSPQDFRENAQNLAGLSAVVTKRDAAIKEDPALYVMHSAPVDTAYNAMQTVMKAPLSVPAVQQAIQQAAPAPAQQVAQQTQQPQQVSRPTQAQQVVQQVMQQAAPAQAQQVVQRAQQAAISNYVDATTAMQTHLGIAKEDQRILPKAAAVDIASQFNTLPAKQGESGGQNAAQLMQQLQATWGKHYPEVFKQLAKDGNLPGVALVVGAMDMPSQQPAAEQLAEAAANGGRKVYVDLLTGSQKTDLTDALVKEMLPFSKTLAFQSGGSNTISAFHDGVELLAMSYITQGTDDAATAASRAYDEVLGKKYQIQDTYRVPQPWDAGIIAAGADVAMAELSGPLKVDQYGYSGPGGGPELKLQEEDLWQQHADSVRGFGFWLTNSDETGLDLYDPSRHRVQRPDGTPISFTWDELNTKAAGHPAVRPGQFKLPLPPPVYEPGQMLPGPQ